jgi:heme/copper-type cytochrome/quinol oxidase subunit 4
LAFASCSGQEEALVDPIRVFAVIVLISLPTVMFGGQSLLRLMSRNQLSAFQLTYFRAGHAHAGVLLVFALAYLAFLARTDFGAGLRWVAGALLMAGILAQSGGMFLHMGIGKPQRWSVGNTLSTVSAVILGIASLLLAYGVIVATHVTEG